MQRSKNNNFLLIIFTVNILSITGDTWMTWLSPIYPKLYSNDASINPFGRPITSEEDTWIGSILNIGSLIGPLPFGFIAEKFGRKIGILSLALPHLISFLTVAFAKEVYLYYFARFLAGLAIGGSYSLLPMYMAEITEDSQRGKTSASLNVFWCVGNLTSLVLGPYLSIMSFNLILACLPPIFFLIFFFICPESPYYLVARNEMQKAEESMKKLRSNPDIAKKELECIKNTMENETQGTIIDILKSKSMRKALWLTLVLMTILQMSGFKAIVFYLQFIFDATGSDIPSEISAIIFGIVLFASSLLTPFVSDKWGRRGLLISSLIGTTISHAIIGTFFYLLNETDYDTSAISWLPLLGLISYITCFNFGIGPLAWTISSELFPNNVKSSSSSIVSSYCWLVAFVLTKCFNDMRMNFGEYGVFWLFGLITLMGAIFSFIFIPETKGKSFYEIQMLLTNEKPEKINNNLHQIC